MERVSKRPELTDDTMVKLYNESGGPFYYVTEHVKRNFPEGGSREVPLKELKDLILTKGHRGAFDRGYLIIRDERVRELFALEPLSNYNIGQKEMIELLEKKDMDALEDFLQYTSDENLEKIVRVAVDLPVEDLNKANLIASYSGYNIISLISEKKEQKAAATGVRQKVGATAPDDPATPARRKKITPQE